MAISTRVAATLVAASVLLVLAAGCDDTRPWQRRIEGRSSPVIRRRSAVPSDPLPSWQDGTTKTAIVQFVARVSQKGPSFVPVEERIAVFDNDGTLWVEQPTYAQVAFAVDRVKQLAPAHPEWTSQEPFASVLSGNLAGIAASGESGVAAMIAATHANTTTDEFERIVSDWIGSARHPTLGRRYTELAYQPMLELLEYLRAHEFSTFIVSGGGVEFMRPWTERVYGVRREQVVGSRAKLTYEFRDGGPVLLRLPAIDLLDDKAGKPVGIQQVIGRRPIAAFGNSDGDFEMLEWVTSGPGPRLGVLVHHTDGEREFAYDRESAVGKLARGLDAAPRRGWLVVDMKKDWRRVFGAGRPMR
jgi:phosphoserine phosphatase